MRPSYGDIHAAVLKHNLTIYWFDEAGCPRLAPFHFDLMGVYDSICMLVEIQCQSCRGIFRVAEGWSDMQLFRMRENFPLVKDRLETEDRDGPAILPTIMDLAQRYHYGDPPIHGCIGDTMNSVPRRVLEGWSKDGKETEKKEGVGLVITKMPEWTRRPDVEALDLTPDWATNGWL